MGTVDILDGSGDAGTATAIARRLSQAGIAVGTISTGEATSSSVEHPAARREAATLLAGAIGRPSAVGAGSGNVTLVIGSDDAGRVLSALRSAAGRADLACAAG